VFRGYADETEVNWTDIDREFNYVINTTRKPQLFLERLYVWLIVSVL
jgi:hypothetical protein